MLPGSLKRDQLSRQSAQRMRLRKNADDIHARETCISPDALEAFLIDSADQDSSRPQPGAERLYDLQALRVPDLDIEEQPIEMTSL